MPAAQPAFAGGRAGSGAADEPSAPVAERSRAVAIAEAVAAAQRREAFAPAPPAAQLASAAVAEAAGRHGGASATSPAVPLGQSGKRRTRGRVSSGAQRRDRNR